MDAATQWGLPPGFSPVRYAISDDAKNTVRPLLGPNEPVILSLANEGDAVSLVGTPQRLLLLKIGGMGAGASGVSVKEFPWEGIFGITLRPQSLNSTLAITYRSSDRGKTVEVGRRAMMAKEVVENLQAFESQAAQEAYEAIFQISNFKRAQNS